jgi:hypothetical protein
MRYTLPLDCSVPFNSLGSSETTRFNTADDADGRTNRTVSDAPIEKSVQLMIARLDDWRTRSVFPKLDTTAEPATTRPPCGAPHAQPAGNPTISGAIARSNARRVRAVGNLMGPFHREKRSSFRESAPSNYRSRNCNRSLFVLGSRARHIPPDGER